MNATRWTYKLLSGFLALTLLCPNIAWANNDTLAPPHREGIIGELDGAGHVLEDSKNLEASPIKVRSNGALYEICTVRIKGTKGKTSAYVEPKKFTLDGVDYSIEKQKVQGSQGPRQKFIVRTVDSQSVEKIYDLSELVGQLPFYKKNDSIDEIQIVVGSHHLVELKGRTVVVNLLGLEAITREGSHQETKYGVLIRSQISSLSGARILFANLDNLETLSGETRSLIHAWLQLHTLIKGLEWFSAEDAQELLRNLAEDQNIDSGEFAQAMAKAQAMKGAPLTQYLGLIKEYGSKAGVYPKDITEIFSSTPVSRFAEMLQTHQK